VYEHHVTEKGIVIVGGGLAAARTAEQLRRSEYTGPVTIVSDEGHLPYDRPPLSKEVLRKEVDDVALKPREFYDEKDITLRLGAAATSLDTAAQTLTLGDGTVLGYDELVIATKGGLVRPGPGQWEPDGRPEHLREACEGSLARLRLDMIDLYQFHRPDPKVPIAESISALAELKDEGKIRHVGVSNFTEEQLREAERVTPVVSVQNRYNAVDRSSESMVDLCDQEMLVFLPWAPVQGTDRSRAVQDAARNHGVSPYQIVLAWLLARSPQILPIPGTSSPVHVEENVEAASIELTADELAAINKAAPKFVRSATDQVIGGVAPTGHPTRLRTVVDETLARYPVIWTAAGTPDSVMPLTYEQLLAVTEGVAVQVR